MIGSFTQTPSRSCSTKLTMECVPSARLKIRTKYSAVLPSPATGDSPVCYWGAPTKRCREDSSKGGGRSHGVLGGCGGLKDFCGKVYGIVLVQLPFEEPVRVCLEAEVRKTVRWPNVILGDKQHCTTAVQASDSR